jgi:hypothetical protein
MGSHALRKAWFRMSVNGATLFARAVRKKSDCKISSIAARVSRTIFAVVNRPSVKVRQDEVIRSQGRL